MAERQTPSADVVILNYELLGKFEMELKRAPWDLIVFDETHFLKTPEAQRTRAAKRLVPYARRRVCLTGTPMLGRPCELWSILNLLDPAEWPNFYVFAHRYCDAVKTSWGWDFSGASNISELSQRLHHSGLWLRRRKRDVLTQLPRIRRQTIALEIGRPELLAALSEELAEELGTKVEDFSELLDPERIPFELMSRIRRVTATLKTEEALKFIKEESEGYDSKIVIFGHHRDVLEKLAGSSGKRGSRHGRNAFGDAPGACGRLSERSCCPILRRIHCRDGCWRQSDRFEPGDIRRVRLDSRRFEPGRIQAASPRAERFGPGAIPGHRRLG